jgi:hypothetical protein
VRTLTLAAEEIAETEFRFAALKPYLLSGVLS